MKKSKFKFYDIDVYSEKLDNGLEVYVIPNNNVKDVYVTFNTKYGGCNYNFKLNNKLIKVPNGIAHFLEHKMFEQEDGTDPFTFYNESGTYSNAYTNYFNTTSLFAGNTNIEENLNYLLDFVQSPYFTDSNVEKEKGIISEEIKMYEDMPDDVMMQKVMYNLFNSNPSKNSIIGTVSDIESITKEDLYNTYNAFYHPSNMFLVITGNVDKNIIEVVKNNQKNKIFKENKVEIIKPKEKDSVYKEKEIIKHNVKMPLVAYSIKIPTKNINIDKKKLNLYLSNLFNILFDDTSLFYEKMKDNNLLQIGVDIDNMDVEDYKIFIISFRADNYNEVIKEIDCTLDNIIVDKKDLERKKKVNLSDLLYIFDDINRTNKLVLNNIVLYDNIYLDIYDLIKEMNIEELNNIIKNINLKNKSILVIESRD